MRNLKKQKVSSWRQLRLVCWRRVLLLSALASSPTGCLPPPCLTNLNPTADGGPDTEAEVGSRVVLDGSASTDPDDDSLTHRWEQTAGPAVSISDANSRTASCVPLEPGNYEFCLTVTDGCATDESCKRVFVSESRDCGCPFADAGVDQTVRSGESVTLRGDNSAHPDGETLNYWWSQLAGQAGVSLSNVFLPDPTFTAPQVERTMTLTFELVVTVDCETCRDSDQIMVTIEPTVPPPDCTSDTECDDGAFCNGSESCENGLCEPGVEPCSPEEMCDEATDSCPECFEDADCDDGSFCNGIESCQTGLCQEGDTPCDPADICDEVGDSCVECMADADCDDGQACTVDTCGAGSQVCVHNEITCPDGGACDPESGACGLVCQDNTDCDDGVACTVDMCDGSTGTCSHENNCPAGFSCDLASGDCQAESACSAPCERPLTLTVQAFDAGGTDTSQVAVTDLDGDGAQDLLVANRGAFGRGHGLAFLKGRGDTSFDPPNLLADEFATWDVAIGDLNNDGISDVVTSDIFNGTISLFRGNGTASLGEPTRCNVGLNPAGLALGDLNLDGHLDIVAANSGEGTISVVLGDGELGCGWQQVLDAQSEPVIVDLGDYDGDGNLDILVSDPTFNSSNVSLYWGFGDGSFTPQEVIESGGNGSWSLAGGDFDADGNRDFLVTFDHSNRVCFRFGAGGGDFAPASCVELGAESRDVAVADFDCDGYDDAAIATAGNGNLTMLLSNGDRSFEQSSYASGNHPVGIAAGDLDADGDQDVIVTNWDDGDVTTLKNRCVP